MVLQKKVDVSIEHHKVQHVAKGFHIKEGVDYLHTYSPIVKPTTIWSIFSLTVTNKWTIRQLYIINTFLSCEHSE